MKNVNKVNTKATLRCAVDSSWIPSWASSALMNNVIFRPRLHAHPRLNRLFSASLRCIFSFNTFIIYGPPVTSPEHR